jgi:Cof subfamily protein (haloacid dehalogenase superfamily)
VNILIKLIAIDLDGTLLDSKKRIPEENVNLVRKLVTTGYQVVIATGRRYYSAKMMTEALGGHFVILANNGNIVRSTDDDKLIISKFLDSEAYRDILIEAENSGLKGIVHVDMFSQGVDMVLEEDESGSDHLKYITEGDNRYLLLPKKELLKLDRVLAVVYPGKSAVLKDFRSRIDFMYPDRYSSHVLENINIAEAMYEAMNPGGSKWKTLYEYATLNGIKREEILAIGDDNNDVEMILNAGIGIAMKNGSQLAKDAADIITDQDNDEAGLAYTLADALKIFY